MDNKLLIAKINDKIKINKNQNKLVNTDFLNEFEIEIVKKEIYNLRIKNCFFYGGYKEANRKILIIYPEKIDEEQVIKNINNIINVIKIEIPNEIKGKLKHKDFLGIIMSMGLVRERIGDIIVFPEETYIVVLKDNTEYIINELKQEKRLKKSKIEVVDVNNIKTKLPEFEIISISVNSFRLDNIVSELLKTSRKIAQEKIQEEKIFINYMLENRNTKIIKEGDILVIRGQGKYIFEERLGKNRKR